MEDEHRRFRIKGEREEIRLAKATIDRCTFDFDMLRGNVEIKFKPPGQMEKLDSGKPALAFCHSKRRVLHINSAARKRTQRSVLIHEIGHMVDRDRLRPAKRSELMSLMRRPAVKWRGGAYQQRACECFAETFVRAFSDVRSSLEGYYGRHVDDEKLPRYREVIMRGGQDEPEEPDEEEPEEGEGEIDLDDTATLADDDDEVEHSARIPVGIVPGQVGTIADGTPFLHPDSGIRITTAAGTQQFDLVGKTLDGRFRFAVIRTTKLVEGEALRALLMVNASRVSSVQPPDEE